MREPPALDHILRRELQDWRIWASRAVLVSAAVAAGLAVVGFTWLTEQALMLFSRLQHAWWWSPLLWTPLSTAAIVALTRRWVPGAAGSGIPQVMAALDTTTPVAQRGLFVSLRLSAAKVGLTAWGMLAGLSLGREGPSVQIAAGILHSVRGWLPLRTVVTTQGLLVAGGAAGIAAAFNTPLAGVMFAIEELSRSLEQRSSGMIIAAIVLAGVVAVSIHGNETYFGVLHVGQLDWRLLGPGLVVAISSGVAGGLFSRLLIVSLQGQGTDVLSRLRRSRPVLFAGVCGLLVAAIGVVNDGATFGSGYAHTRAMLEGAESLPLVHALFKFMATWLTTWSGVPGGIFAPSLAIGGALGHDVSVLMAYPQAATLMALGMAGFLAAVTQAPMTAFIIVMEMVNAHEMVLSIMASALVATLVARAISRPLYGELAALQRQRLSP